MSRLTEERLNELYTGTLELVAEHGYDKLTMDQIAEATKSSKATLYRQWGSKATLVVEALQYCGGPEPELPDTGTLRGDLKAMSLHKGGQDEHDSELITAIIHAMKQNDELAEAVRTQQLNAITSTGRNGGSTGASVSTRVEKMVPLSAFVSYGPGTTPR